MTNKTVENVYTRHTAKELTKQYFWKLAGMMAIAFGIPYGLTIIVPAIFAPVGTQSNMYVTVTFVTAIVAGLLDSGLTLGLLRSFIDLCRGENVRVSAVFQHMHMTLRGFGLGLWVGLKTLLWALPAYALVAVAVIFSLNTNQTTQPSEELLLLYSLLPIGMIVAVFAMVVPAVMRYMLSTFIMADKPNTGVFECVRQSKAMMKGHKWQAFKLVIPVILVMYVIFIVAGVVIGAASAFLATTEAMVTILTVLTYIVMIAIVMYYTIRMHLCYCIFYNNRLTENTPVEPAAEAAAE